jgi:hypothetical protein
MNIPPAQFRRLWKTLPLQWQAMWTDVIQHGDIFVGELDGTEAQHDMAIMFLSRKQCDALLDLLDDYQAAERHAGRSQEKPEVNLDPSRN